MKIRKILPVVVAFAAITLFSAGCLQVSYTNRTKELLNTYDSSDSTSIITPGNTTEDYSSEHESDKLINQIGDDMIGQKVTIRGVISKVKRFDSGHASAILTDSSGEITIYIHRDSLVDLMMLISDHEHLVSGIVDSYKGELQVLPEKTDDIVLVSGIQFETAIVVKIVDGDTIHVKLNSGQVDTIRMIGVDTPELAKDGQTAEFYADESKSYAEDLLTGNTVYLEKDYDDEDQYGRKLRYVWLSQPNIVNEQTARQNLLSAKLIAGGYAEFVHYNNDRKYKELLSVIESEARDKELGMWRQ